MTKKTKQDLRETALKLINEGYKNLYAIDDGQFFTDRELANIAAKRISSEVFRFTSEDLANTAVEQPEPESGQSAGNDPKPVIDPDPVLDQDVVTDPEPSLVDGSRIDPEPASEQKSVSKKDAVKQKKVSEPKKK